jgi:flagellar M-ring protein FliF
MMAKVPAEAGAMAAGPIQSDALEGLASLGVLRQLALLIGLAASVALGVAVVLWSMDEEYQPLYTNLDHMDPTQVLNTLQTNEIRFKVDQNSGALLVAANQIQDARLKLAAEGVSADGSFGFELMEKEQPLGSSQFMENARYRRSLEGELARTITNIRAVRSARVHLAIPKTTAFIRDTRRPSASVFVDLYSGIQITPDQVRAIAHLVASSIPELLLEDVTVVDQRGKLLSNFESDQEMAVANKQLDYTREVEQRMIKRIASILEPLVGAGKYRAEVNADIDFTAVEQAEELYNPDLPALRSEQTVSEGRGAGAVGGVPGALTNQPPAVGQAPEQAGAGGAAVAGNGSSRAQAIRNYELDRTVSFTKHQVGRLRRLSVAVVVDNIVSVSSETGQSASAPLDQQALDRLTSLVRDAVGYDVTRGDRVNVINAPFLALEEVELPAYEEAPIWEQPVFMQYGRWVLGALGLLVLVFGFLRPMMKGLTDSAKQMREMEAQQALEAMGGELGDLGNETVTLSGGDSMLLPGPGQNYEQQLEAVKGLIAEDPGRVAQVVKKWVAASE